MSMSPGATTCPRASITRRAGRAERGSTAAIRPSSTATSASRPGAPLPSMTRPPRISRSSMVSLAHASPEPSQCLDYVRVLSNFMISTKKSAVVTRYEFRTLARTFSSRLLVPDGEGLRPPARRPRDLEQGARQLSRCLPHRKRRRNDLVHTMAVPAPLGHMGPEILGGLAGLRVHRLLVHVREPDRKSTRLNSSHVRI